MKVVTGRQYVGFCWVNGRNYVGLVRGLVGIMQAQLRNWQALCRHTYIGLTGRKYQIYTYGLLVLNLHIFSVVGEQLQGQSYSYLEVYSKSYKLSMLIYSNHCHRAYYISPNLYYILDISQQFLYTLYSQRTLVVSYILKQLFLDHAVNPQSSFTIPYMPNHLPSYYCISLNNSYLTVYFQTICPYRVFPNQSCHTVYSQSIHTSHSIHPQTTHTVLYISKQFTPYCVSSINLQHTVNPQTTYAKLYKYLQLSLTIPYIPKQHMPYRTSQIMHTIPYMSRQLIPHSI